jgi:hypothetical protein
VDSRVQISASIGMRARPSRRSNSMVNLNPACNLLSHVVCFSLSWYNGHNTNFETR